MPVIKAVQPVGAQKAQPAAAKVVAPKTVASGKTVMAPKSKPIETVTAAGTPAPVTAPKKQPAKDGEKGAEEKKKGGKKSKGGWGDNGDWMNQMMNYMWEQWMQGGPQAHLSADDITKRKEKLLRLVSARLTKNGGEEPLSAIMGDTEISSLKKNAIGNVAKFLREYPQYFEFKYVSNPNEGKKDIQVVVLLQPVPEGSLGGLKRKREELPAADCHEALIQAIADALADAGGSATVSDVGLDTRVLSAAVNVRDKLGKFMGKYPEVFTIEPQTGNPIPKVTLVGAASSAVASANVRAKLSA